MAIVTPQDKTMLAGLYTKFKAFTKARAKLRSMRSLWAVEAENAFLLAFGVDTEEPGWAWQGCHQAHLITQRAFATGFRWIPGLPTRLVAIVPVRAFYGHHAILVFVDQLSANALNQPHGLPNTRTPWHENGACLRRHCHAVKAVTWQELVVERVTPWTSMIAPYFPTILRLHHADIQLPELCLLKEAQFVWLRLLRDQEGLNHLATDLASRAASQPRPKTAEPCSHLSGAGW